MFKLVLLLSFIAIASTYPSGLYTSHGIISHPSLLAFQQPAFANVGNLVQNIPSAVSSQSTTFFHDKDIVSSILSPTIKSIHTPVLNAVPLSDVKHVGPGPIIPAEGWYVDL